MSAFFDAVADIFVGQFNIAKEKVVPGARFNADLGLDSLAELELAMALQERFDVNFTTEEMSQMATVDDVLVRLDGKLKDRGAAIEGAGHG